MFLLSPVRTAPARRRPVVTRERNAHVDSGRGEPRRVALSAAVDDQHRPAVYAQQSTRPKTATVTAGRYALRRWWHQVGDAPLHVVKSQVLFDQMERGRGAVEVVEAPHDFRYLRSLAGLRTPGGGEPWGDEPLGRDVHLTGAANAAGGESPDLPER